VGAPVRFERPNLGDGIKPLHRLTGGIIVKALKIIGCEEAGAMLGHVLHQGEKPSLAILEFVYDNGGVRPPEAAGDFGQSEERDSGLPNGVERPVVLRVFMSPALLGVRGMDLTVQPEVTAIFSHQT